MSLVRRPSFWIAYVAVAAVALVVAWRVFPLAIPLVSLDIRMARHEALDSAAALAALHGLAAPDAKSAVRFSSDSATQSYVELEAGGKPAFAELVAGTLYSPYSWDVRLFKAGEVAEAMIRLRPDGTPDGFTRRLAETYVRDPATRALDAAAARALAEARARDEWKVDLADYRLLEQSQETRTSGRVDHAFVYERPEKLGDARIRLRLLVSGDELTGVVPFVHVPEAFQRRFEEMRSANNSIAGAASLVAGVLYGIGGCVLGVLWLARRHAIVWRPPLVAGLVVGGLMGAMLLASAPSSWFGFDTAQSEGTFWARQAGMALGVFFAGGLAYALVFMAAEGLSRVAFPHQPQLWKVWSREGGASVQTLGRTVGGYLFVPLELAMIALFYYATNRWLGWWQPSEVLTDPNILSSAVPALSPIAISLQAGFMEESLFRAIPLALGALIGQRFGSRFAGIALAVVLQALVFGGGHANYPGFPSYSRLVELLLPSIVWALIFLRFGLLPTILLHALFDLALMSIPVFLVDAPGALAQRALVIVAGLVPLGIVLFRRMQAGAWNELPAGLRNGGWLVAQVGAEAATPERRPVDTQRLARSWRWLPILGAAGLAAWLAFSPFRTDVPTMTVDRAQAEARADEALAQRGVKLDAKWRRSSTIRTANDEAAHKFVWQESGPEAYRALVGRSLAPPLWDVRYATFEGDVADRAEEWHVTIGPDGAVRQVRHALPEARPGAKLARDEAKTLAERTLQERLGLDPAKLELVAADEQARPARADWVFTFRDPDVKLADGGEGRALVTISGDEVSGIGRMVHVPEAWLRGEREKEGRYTALKIASGLAVLGGALAALLLGIRSWVRRRSDGSALRWTIALSLLGTIVTVANRWPQLAFGLSTAEPPATQLALRIGGALLGGAMLALLLGLAAGVGAWSARRTPDWGGTRRATWIAGIGAALATAGISTALQALSPHEAPTWPTLTLASTAVPWIGALVQGLVVVSASAVGLFALHVLERVTAHWTRRRWLVVVMLVLLFGATAATANDPWPALVGGLIEAAIASVLVFALFRHAPRTVPVFAATTVLLEAAERAAQLATSVAWAWFGLTALVVLVATWAIDRHLAQPLAPEAVPA